MGKMFSLDDREREIIKQCPIDIYVASNMPYEYPFKILKPEYESDRIIDSSETTILDSGIGDDITNREVLSKSSEGDYNFVVAKDYLNDMAKTTESINEFYEIYNDEKHPTPLIPLQPPHVEHYNQLKQNPKRVLLGGIKDNSPRRQIQYVEDFNREIDVEYLHVLGVGMSEEFVKFIRSNKNAVDSVDCSTPEQAVINNNYIDAHMKQKGINVVKGKSSSILRYRLSQYFAIQLNYVMSDKCDNELYEEIDEERDIINF